MLNVEYLLGNDLQYGQNNEPFSPSVCNFIADLSKELMKRPEAKIYADIISFAFWCRPSNIKKQIKALSLENNRLGRGLAFHITPSNVPVNFAFSFVFSLLAGNANIVRLPSNNFPQVEIILSVIKDIIVKYPDIKDCNTFIRYAINNEITEYFSQKADVRIIWGGDVTIESIKKLSSKPKCVDICFPDRYSFAIFNGEAIKSANDLSMARLAEDFYNDTYLMDQNACSSPKIIFWQHADDEIKNKFWQAVEKFATYKYKLMGSSVIDKFEQSCRDSSLLATEVSIIRHTNLIYRVSLSTLPEEITNLRGHSGYFYEYDIDEFNNIKNIITEKYQTATYYGIDPKKLRDFVINSRLSGIDRIVPVGSAMDIGLIWDGFDLIRTMSRIVDTI